MSDKVIQLTNLTTRNHCSVQNSNFMAAVRTHRYLISQSYPDTQPVSFDYSHNLELSTGMCTILERTLRIT